MVLRPLQSLATQTGALAFTGAEADKAGSTFVCPLWTLTSDWLVDGSAEPPLEPVEAPLVPPPELCCVEPPPQSLATQTGASALTGAEADTAGSTLVCPGCTLPADWSTDCEPPELVELVP